MILKYLKCIFYDLKHRCRFCSAWDYNWNDPHLAELWSPRAFWTGPISGSRSLWNLSVKLVRDGEEKNAAAAVSSCSIVGKCTKQFHTAAILYLCTVHTISQYFLRKLCVLGAIGLNHVQTDYLKHEPQAHHLTYVAHRISTLSWCWIWFPEPPLHNRQHLWQQGMGCNRLECHVLGIRPFWAPQESSDWAVWSHHSASKIASLKSRELLVFNMPLGDGRVKLLKSGPQSNSRRSEDVSWAKYSLVDGNNAIAKQGFEWTCSFS